MKWLRLVGLLVACGIAGGGRAVGQAADAPPLIPRAVLFGNPVKAAPQLSPDGKRLAWLAPVEVRDGTTTRDVLNVWVETLGKGDARPVTRDRGRGIRGFFWRGDSRHVFYAQDRDGDENWRLYMTDVVRRRTLALTPATGPLAGKLQARVLGTVTERPDELLVGLNARDARYHDVYRMRLLAAGKSGAHAGSAETTAALQLEMQNPGDVSGWLVDHDLQLRGAHAMLPDGSTEIRWHASDRGPMAPVLRWGPEDYGGVSGISPDNRRLWVSTSVGANAARLTEFDPATSATRVLAEDARFDVDALMTQPARHTLEAVRFVRARRDWQFIDPAMLAEFRRLRLVRRGDIQVVSRDYADRRWVVQYITDDGPNYYYLFDRATGWSKFLFSDRPALERYTLAPMQPVAFAARDGLPLEGYLSLPPGVTTATARTLPLVLEVHGGPWSRDLWGYNASTQWLANRGYVVLKINFRGSTGYGKRHLNAGDREWAGKMHDDLIDGVQWALARGIGDPTRVAIMGGSYGGYAALVGLTFTPEVFAAGVSVVGPSSLVTLLDTIPPYWETERAELERRVGRRDERAFLESRSPLFRVDKIRAPLLLAQGANDPRVKQAESDQIAAAARHNGVDVTYLLFPDEGHGFARPENRLRYYAAAEAFLARHLGGRAEPPTPAEDWQHLLVAAPATAASH